jgi:hypothetical protein
VQLALAKCGVVNVQQGEHGCKFRMVLPGGATVEVDNSFPLDVRVGDLLTLYTEVYRAQPSSYQ